MSMTTWWQTYGEMEARLTAPVSERMVELAGLRPGMSVLDLASGAGEPALRAARCVAPTGLVLGTDIDEGVLALARERALREGITNVQFHVADAASLAAPEGFFDAVTVRWGLMYMLDVERALEQVRRVLKPSGVLVAALWAEPARVPWATVPREALAPYRELPRVSPEAPGAFRFAEQRHLDALLTRAGFRVETVEEMEVPVVEGPDGAAIVAWARAGPMSRLVADLSEDARRRWEADLARAVEPLRAGGRILLGGVTRLVVARS